MLLLFDIDGTLIRVGGAGRRALSRAFEAVLGVKDAMNGVRLDGGTDLGIIDAAYRLHLDRAAKAQEIDKLLAAYLAFLDDELQRSTQAYEVMPGAKELALAACASGRAAVGLATGNIEAGARRKLARAELNTCFAFGGFGSDSHLRAELVQRAIERGQEHGEQYLGRRFHRDEIFVIGDTELDVAAARACDVVAIGVLHGCASKETLTASKPDLLLPSLDDETVWTKLGLTR